MGCLETALKRKSQISLLQDIWLFLIIPCSVSLFLLKAEDAFAPFDGLDGVVQFAVFVSAERHDGDRAGVQAEIFDYFA